MKREHSYERRQMASRMEACLLLVTGIGIVGALFALFRAGWLPSLAFLILSSLAFGLSRLFDLVGDLLVSIEKPSAPGKPESPEDSHG